MWFFLVVGACASYEPKPITRESTNAALTVPPADVLRARVAHLRGPASRTVNMNLEALSPDAAAVLAVLVNPGLRVERNRRALASAQLLQAGILPNPQFDFNVDPVSGGATAGTITGYGFGVSWEVTSLITHDAKVAAARAEVESVKLDVAWAEWQVAQGARKAVYDLLGLYAQLAEVQTVERRMSENLDLIHHAADAHQKTLLDLAAAETASQQARADVLARQADVRHQQLMLNQALGLGPDVSIRLQNDLTLPARLDLPDEHSLLEGLEDRRLDLMALRRGYASQEQTVRAAVLAQFPKINLGFHRASDTTNVHTIGFGATIDLPIFDQNQGNIAVERATRQKLYDEYMSRVYEARSAIALSRDDIRSLEEQIDAANTAIPALQRLVDTYKTATSQGNADVLSYYTAQNDLAQKRIDILKLKQQLIDNQIAIELAAGEIFPVPPGPTSSPATQPASTTQEGHP